jgi:hypothetical protein
VQVEGDGTLVPATEEDVLEFEHFLQDEKVDLPSIEDVGHVEQFFSNDCILLKKPDLEGNLYSINKFSTCFSWANLAKNNTLCCLVGIGNTAW